MLASDKVTCALPTHEFARKRTGKPSFTFSAFPFCVDFHGLLKQKTDIIFPGVSKWDLLNIVIALYDVCLPDIGLETLRENICASGSKTILLLRHPQDVLKEYQEKSISPPSSDCLHTSSVPFPIDGEEEEAKASVFSSVFSDSESSEEEEDSDSDREEIEKFHSSLRDFLRKVVERRQKRTQSHLTSEAIGVESCIVAALTFKRSALKSKEKILELSLLSTRRRFRCCGVGTHMLMMLKDVSLVGFYDSIVTHADSGAVQFFKSCGFSDDLILNSKFRDLEDEWTNTTTMSYFPPFSAVPTPQKDLTDLEMEMELWKMKSIAAYQAQSIFINRIFQEIQTLRKQVASQEDLIRTLTTDLEKTKNEKYQLEKKYLLHQLGGLHFSIDTKDLLPGAIKTSELQEYVTVTNDECVEQPMAVQDCVQASLPKNVLLNVKAHISKLVAPVIHQRLYYCRGQQGAERLEDILTTGFSEHDFHQGEYGTGLYFSASPAAAGDLSPVLVADVYIGRTEVVYQKQPGRLHPSEGCDSLLVPGMMHSLLSPPYLEKEFVIFSPLQAIPVCLLTYTQKVGERRPQSADCPVI